MITESWIGIDIGGANLKLANAETSFATPFEIWKAPHELAEKLTAALRCFAPWSGLAITMTAELSDCFTSRQDGVHFICDTVESIAAGKTVWTYQTNGRFVSLEAAKTDWLLTAASNWHATANWISKTHTNCIVVDIGSTTTDITPVSNGRVAAIGNTDFSRLINHELVYQGADRTPVPSLLPSLRINDSEVAIAKEFFATVKDAYTILGLHNDAEDCSTADGRPANKLNACRRLAKLLCLDVSELTESQFTDIAQQIHQANLNSIASSIKSVADRTSIDKFVVLGEGDWLGTEAIRATLDRFEILDVFNKDKSSVGPAYAVYQLIQQNLVGH